MYQAPTPDCWSTLAAPSVVFNDTAPVSRLAWVSVIVAAEATS